MDYFRNMYKGLVDNSTFDICNDDNPKSNQSDTFRHCASKAI